MDCRPGEGHGNPLQYSCMENPMDRGAGQATSTHSHKESDSTEVTWHAHMDEATRLPCLFLTRILEWVTISFSRDLPN